MAPTTSTQRTVATCAAVTALLGVLRRVEKRKKRVWVMSWLLRKEIQGENIMMEMCLEDETYLYCYHRMKKEVFEYLLNLVEPPITKQDTKLRKSIPHEQQLSVTLMTLSHR